MKMTYKLNILLFLTVIALLTSCKKDYTCTCTDPAGNKTIAFTEKTTKGKASAKCDQHYNSTYGSVPFNETSCSIE